jgi:hypothetical protein
MKLDKNDKKLLNTLCLYLGSYGTKTGKVEFNFYNDAPELDHYSGIQSPDVRIKIDEIPDFFELAEKITIPLIEDKIDYYDTSGTVRFCVDCSKKLIFFEGWINEMNTNYSTDEYAMEELNEVNGWNEFLKEVRKYKTGRVTYEGSGDSGFIEENMKIKDKYVSIPAGLETWLYNQLEQYGGWEINEGSQGFFDFNFENGTIYLEHGENYEESVEFPLEMEINF